MLTLRELKKQLKAYTKEALINELTSLHQRFPAIQDHFASKFAPELDTQILERYKRLIQKEFLPERGLGKARISVARKVVQDYTKVSRSDEGIAKIMLYYVEIGVQYTLKYGDIDDPFYSSLESMYGNLLKHISRHALESQFQRQVKGLLTNTENVSGWLHDAFTDLYEKWQEENK